MAAQLVDRHLRVFFRELVETLLRRAAGSTLLCSGKTPTGFGSVVAAPDGRDRDEYPKSDRPHAG